MATVTNFANAYQSVLTADMAATDLVASVQSTDRAPASPCYLVIDPENTNREYILFDGSFTATTFSATTINNRYLSGSAAASGLTHAAGAVVRFSPLAQHFTDLHGLINDRPTFTEGDARFTNFLRGVLADRPAAGVSGRIFEVTGDATADNNGRIFSDTGAAWHEVALLNTASALPRRFSGSIGIVPDGWVSRILLSARGSADTERLELHGEDETKTGFVRVFTNNYIRDVELRSRVGSAFFVNSDNTLEAMGAFARALDLASIPQGSASPAILLNHNYGIFADNLGGGTANNRLWINAPSEGEVIVGPRSGGSYLYAFHVSAKLLLPLVDNRTSLGQSSRRYTEVWAVNGAIQTSDSEEKVDIEPIPDDTAVERVRRVGKEAAISYRWPDGTRRHVGFDAQKVGVIHGETSAAYIDPTYEADARTNPYTDEPTAEWYAERVDPDADADEQAEQRTEAEREWVEARDEFDRETAEIRDAPKGLRPSEMVPDLYAALAKALDRIDALEAS